MAQINIEQVNNGFIISDKKTGDRWIAKGHEAIEQIGAIVFKDMEELLKSNRETKSADIETSITLH